jgi:hypothetical protein
VCALFCVCVALYLGRSLAAGRSLVQGVLPIVYRSEKYNNLDTVRVRYKRNGYTEMIKVADAFVVIKHEDTDSSAAHCFVENMVSSSR